MSQSYESKSDLAQALASAGQALANLSREDLASVAKELSGSLDIEKLERLAKLARKAQSDSGGGSAAYHY
jgi:hypothetical protein